MVYTFDEESNSIIIASCNDYQVCDIFNKTNEDNGENFIDDYIWQPGYLIIGGGGLSKVYEIYLSNDHKEFKHIIKVKKPYYEFEFEDFFNIGSNCKYWSPNIVIGIS